MDNILLLIICFLCGILFRRFQFLPTETPSVLNAYIIYLSLPALILRHIPGLTFDAALAVPVAMPYIVFITGLVFFYIISKIFRFNRETTTVLMLTGGLGNTSFVGLPMLAAFYGPESLAIGIMADQAGTFLTLSTLGIVTLSVMSGENTSPGEIIKRIVLFPPFLTLIVAVFLRNFTLPEEYFSITESLGNTLTPLALLSVGFQLRLSDLHGNTLPLFFGLFYKLIAAPLLIAALFIGLLNQSGLIIQVTVFEAAMAPMITASIVAMRANQNPSLAAMMVGIGIPLSFLTLPVIYYLLTMI